MKGNQESMLYTTNATVASLNHVHGFDPLKFLRRTASRKTGEDVMRLDLRYKKLWFRLFYPQLGVKLCSMAGGGVQKIYMVFLRKSSRRDRSGSDLFHLRDGFEIKMNFDRNVSCFIFVNALMHDDFFD